MEATGPPVCFTQVNVTAVCTVHFVQVKIAGRESPGARSADSAMASHSAVPLEPG